MKYHGKLFQAKYIKKIIASFSTNLCGINLYELNLCRILSILVTSQFTVGLLLARFDSLKLTVVE